MKETIHYKKNYGVNEFENPTLDLKKKIEENSIVESLYQSSKLYQHFYLNFDGNFLTRTHLDISRYGQKSPWVAKVTVEKVGPGPNIKRKSAIENLLVKEGFTRSRKK